MDSRGIAKTVDCAIPFAIIKIGTSKQVPCIIGAAYL